MASHENQGTNKRRAAVVRARSEGKGEAVIGRRIRFSSCCCFNTEYGRLTSAKHTKVKNSVLSEYLFTAEGPVPKIRVSSLSLRTECSVTLPTIKNGPPTLEWHVQAKAQQPVRALAPISANPRPCLPIQFSFNAPPQKIRRSFLKDTCGARHEAARKNIVGFVDLRPVLNCSTLVNL